jgi:hypothetical protein
MKLFEYRKYKSKSNKMPRKILIALKKKEKEMIISSGKKVALDKKRFFFPSCLYILFENMYIKILFTNKHIRDQNTLNIDFVYHYCAFWFFFMFINDLNLMLSK